MKGAGKAIPWAVVGFIAGATLGLIYGGNVAKRGLSDAVTTRWQDRKVIIELDTIKALAAGF